MFPQSNNLLSQWTVYQVLLLYGLSEYINSTKRGVNLFSQNKEGIFSLFGKFEA